MAETIYVPFGSNQCIVHCTRSIDDLKSILLHGFVPTINPTRIIEPLFHDIGRPVPEADIGMICFTKLDPDALDVEALQTLCQFGPFGIAVTQDWALAYGGRSVAYVKPGGSEYLALQALLKCSCPQPIDHPNFDGRDRRAVEEMVLSNARLPDIFTDPMFSLLLEMLLWVETEQHRDEREFRIRAPQECSGLRGLSKREQVNLILTMSTQLNLPLTFKIQRAQVAFLFSPKSSECQLRSAINDSMFADVPIKAYALQVG